MFSLHIYLWTDCKNALLQVARSDAKHHKRSQWHHQTFKVGKWTTSICSIHISNKEKTGSGNQPKNQWAWSLHFHNVFGSALVPEKQNRSTLILVLSCLWTWTNLHRVQLTSAEMFLFQDDPVAWTSRLWENHFAKGPCRKARQITQGYYFLILFPKLILSWWNKSFHL